MLNRRDYTAAELRTKLLDKDYAEDEVTAALDELTRDRFVDDLRVATSFVRVASGIKGRGRHRIARELEHRGVDKAVIAEALQSMPISDEEENIRRFLARKALPARLSPADHRKVFAQLMRRGFSADLIAKAIRSRTDGSEF